MYTACDLSCLVRLPRPCTAARHVRLVCDLIPRAEEGVQRLGVLEEVSFLMETQRRQADKDLFQRLQT
jgi:hypothetical protein